MRGSNRMESKAIRKRGSRMNDIITNQTNNNWYSVKEMCNVCGVDRRTWVNFKAEFNCETNFPVKRNIRNGDKNADYYPESILKQFQLWLKKNAMNAGGQRTENSLIKQDNQQDLFVGCVLTKGTPEEKRNLAEYILKMADRDEQLELANKAKQQLMLDNQQLREENKLLTEGYDATSKQLSYYRKKYHSWHDDYENY